MRQKKAVGMEAMIKRFTRRNRMFFHGKNKQAAGNTEQNA